MFFRMDGASDGDTSSDESDGQPRKGHYLSGLVEAALEQARRTVNGAQPHREGVKEAGKEGVREDGREAVEMPQVAPTREGSPPKSYV